METITRKLLHLILVLIGVWGTAASALSADYYADLTASLILPPEVENVLSYAVAGDGYGAINTFVNDVLTVSGGPLDGVAVPSADFTEGYSDGRSDTVTIKNLTDHTLDVEINAQVTYEIDANLIGYVGNTHSNIKGYNFVRLGSPGFVQPWPYRPGGGSGWILFEGGPYVNHDTQINDIQTINWSEVLGLPANSSYDLVLRTQLDVYPTPEPGTFLLLGVGLAAVAAYKKRLCGWLKALRWVWA